MKRFVNRNFTSFAVGSLTASMAGGWWCLSYIQSQQRKDQPPLRAASVLDDDSSRVKSREEMRLRAMVENALQSSWKENLNNAVHAQERFMLPGRDHGANPKFVEKIDRRCDELMQQQRKRLKRKQKLKHEEEGEYIEEDMESHQDKIQFWKRG